MNSLLLALLLRERGRRPLKGALVLLRRLRRSARALAVLLALIALVLALAISHALALVLVLGRLTLLRVILLLLREVLVARAYAIVLVREGRRLPQGGLVLVSNADARVAASICQCVEMRSYGRCVAARVGASRVGGSQANGVYRMENALP